MGLPPLEIRVEILTQNLAEARARHQAKVDRYDAGAKRGRRPVPVEHAYRVMRVKAALERAIAAEQAAGQRAQAAQQQAAQQRTQAAPTAHQQLLAPPATVAEQPVEPSTGSTASSEPKRKPVEPKRNITDPQSRMMPLRGGGWLQGYNCQAVTSSDGVIIATSVGNNPSDATAFGEMMDKAVAAAALIDAHRPAAAPTGIGMLLADAGYLSNDNLTAPGPDRLIAVGKRRELAAAAREHPTAGRRRRARPRSRRWRTGCAPPRSMPSTPSAATSPKPRSPTPNTTSGSAASPAAESNGPQPNSASTASCTTSSKPSEPATSHQQPAKQALGPPAASQFRAPPTAVLGFRNSP